MSPGRIFKLLQESCETVESIPVNQNSSTPHNINYPGQSELFKISSGHNHQGGKCSRDDEHTPESPLWCNESSPTKLKLEDGQLLPKHLKDSFDFDTLACRPLQEVDGEYAKAKTFLTIGRDGRVHRFAATQFPFILNPSHPLRRAGIYLLSQWHLPILIAISLTLLSASLLLPNTNSYESHLANVFRYITTILVLGEIFVKAVARGVLASHFTYLRSFWDWLDLIMLLSLILGYCWKHPVVHSLQGIALLKFIPLVPALKEGFGIFTKCLRTFTPPFLYTSVVFWILILLGFKIISYNNSLNNHIHPSCHDILHNITNTTAANDDILMDSGSESSSVLPDVETNSTKTFSGQKFPINCSNTTNTSLLNSTMQFFDFVTLQELGGLGDDNTKFIQLNFLYTIVVLLLGTCGSLIFAISSIKCSFHLFNHLKLLQEVGYSETHAINLKTTTTKPSNNNLINYVTSCLPKTSCNFNCDPSCALLANLNKILYFPCMELFITFVIVTDTFFLFLDRQNFIILSNIHPYFAAGSKVCMIFYTIELLLKLISGPYRYFMSAGVYLDVFVVLAFIVNEFVHPIKWILPIRIFRIAPRWPAFHAILRIIFKTFGSRLMILLTIILGCIQISSKQLFPVDPFSPFAFAFKNWDEAFNDCISINGNSSCVTMFILEILLFTTFFVVLFVSTVTATEKVLQVGLNQQLPQYKSICKVLREIRTRICIPNLCQKGGNASNKPNDFIQRSDTNGQQPQPNGTLKNSTCNNANNHQTSINQNTSESNFPKLELIYLICISLAFLAQAVDFDEKQRINPFYNPRLWIDLPFTLYTFVFLIIIFVVKGVRKQGILNWGFDFLVMLAAGFTAYTSVRSSPSLKDLPGIKLISCFSCLKGLMLIGKVEWLKIGVSGCTHEIRIASEYIAACGIIHLSFSAFQSQVQIFNHTNILAFPTRILGTILIGVIFGVVFFQFQTTDLVTRFLTSTQTTLYSSKKVTLSQEKTRIIPYPKKGLCTPIVHYVTQTDAFEVSLMLIIVFDCLVITFSHLAESKDWQIVWAQYPPLIISVYCIELTLKAYGWRKHFFQSKWNLFDTAIVILCIFDLAAVKIQLGPVTSDFLRFLRIIDIFHVNIIQRHAKKPLMSTPYLFKSMSLPLLNVGLVYFIGVFTYSSIGFMISNKPSHEQEAYSSPLRNFRIFRDIFKSLVLVPFYDISRNKVPYNVIPSTVHPYNQHDWVAQLSSCSRDFYHYLFSIYSFTYLAFSYLIYGTICVIVMSQITKEFVCTLTSSVDLPKDDDDDDDGQDIRRSSVSSRYKYKSRNGMLPLYSISLGESGDDPTSIDTALTPLSEIHQDERINQLSDDFQGVSSSKTARELGNEQEENADNCPVKVSTNGYILRVEAIVTTV